MANIYLKVPTYLAQWYRGRDVDHPLSEFKPVEFSKFQMEYAMMESWMIFVDECDMEHASCFSERMWKNILKGSKPQGGKPVLKRDPTVWPTMDEILFLTNGQRNKKTDGFDYLCIAAPDTIVVGGKIKKVTGSFTLPFRQANALVKQLRREFLRILLHWICEELFAMERRGVQRDVAMCIDHFFYHYNMCLGTNTADRESMRRMSKRWLEEAKMLPDEIDCEDALMVYENEEEKRGMNIDEIITSVKVNTKKR